MSDPAAPSPVLRKTERSVYMFVGMVVLTGYMALMATDAVPPIIILVPVLLLVFGVPAARLDASKPSYRTLTTGITLAYTLVLPILFAVSGLIGGVLWLLVFIQTHKYFHRRARRDYFHILLMAFFMLAVACAQLPGESIALVLMLSLVSGVGACILLQVREELLRAPENALTSLRSPDNPRFREERPARILFRWIFLVNTGVVILVVLVFATVPRMEAGLIHREQSEVAITQQSAEVDVSFSGAILEDTGIVMRVEFPEEPGKRYEGPLYWRITSYNNYSNARWQRAPLQGPILDMAPKVAFDTFRGNNLARTPLGSPKTVFQRIFLDKVPPNGLPALPLPWQVYSPQINTVWGSSLDYTVLPASSTGAMQYEVISEILDYRPEELAGVRDDYRWALGDRNYGLLTRHDLVTQAVSLAIELTGEIESPYLKARAIEEFLSASPFEYSLNIPRHTWASPISQFILNTRTGHCELFASAMALMCRSIGIPARVVSGYLGGEWDEEENACIVRQSMSHLWVEVYLLDVGWVAFDPSPRSDDRYRVFSWMQLAATRLSLQARLFWLSSVVGYRGNLPWMSLAAMVGPVFNLSSIADWAELGTGAGGAVKVGKILLGLLPLVVVAFALAFIRLPARRRRGVRVKLSRDQERARRLYLLLRSRMSALGYNLQGLTAGDLADAADVPGGPLPGTGSETVRRVVGVYNEARFGRAPLGKAQYVRLHAEVRARVRRARGRA
jgi:protein-glutamine gamma-glutamyltransferase